MEENDKKEETYKNEKKVSKWLLNKYSLILIIILALASAIRIYFLISTNGQTLWWDEADYLSTAVHWFFNVPYILNSQRPPLFQFLAGLVLYSGLGEQTIKFLLVVIPSIALVYVVYLLGKDMYDEKIGLIAAFLTATSWTLIFWTDRV